MKDAFPFTDVPPTSTSLAKITTQSVLDKLSSYGQAVCPHIEDGLGDLVEAMWKIADGEMERKLYLSSLDPGVGKTTAIMQFLNDLLESPRHEQVSVMVCVSRLEEVKRMFLSLEQHAHEVAIRVGKDADGVSALSHVEPKKARVLITTQQMVEKLCSGRRFAEVEALHYEGSSRQVRIWDESFLPGEVVSLSEDDLASLIKPLRAYCTDFADTVGILRGELSEKHKGERLEVPALKTLGSDSGVSGLHELSREEPDEGIRKAAQDLAHVAGQELPVHTSMKGVKLLLDYRDTIPSDLAPMVILDASGRCRHTYKLMEKRGDLAKLKKAPKGYGNLRIGVWPTGGGKAAFYRDEDKRLLRGIAQTMRKRPNEDWLIIHHKDQAKQGFIGELMSYLPQPMQARVHFLHWGDHHGTNAFAEIQNVVLAGTLFLPEHAYEGLARLSAGMCDDDDVSATVLKATKEGEHAHAILQALCRASVRATGHDGQCKPCRAYIIASPRSGIPSLLRGLFPGCRLHKWKPLPDKLKGHVKRTIEKIDEIIRNDIDDLVEDITYKELREALGIDKSNFRKLVLRHPSFWEAVEERGLEEATIEEEGRTMKGLQFISHPFMPDPEADDLDL